MQTYTVPRMYQQIGRPLGTSSWHEVRQEDVTAFGRATRDLEDIHLDPEAAIRKGFAGTIAHGIFVLALGPLMLQELFIVEARLALYYGFDKVRFTSPTNVGCRVRMSVSVVGGQEVEGGHRFTYAQVFEAEDSGKPVCYAESVCVYYD